MATQPSLRIGDREREATAAELREHFAHGRLTLDEFNQRLDAVFAAKTQRDLGRITSDLPHVRSGGPPLPSSRTNPGSQFTSGSGAAPLSPASRPGSAATGSGWAGSGSDGHPIGQDWQGQGWQGQGWQGQGWQGDGWQGRDWSGRSARRGGLGVFVTLLAALGSWLLVYDVLLAGWQVPWAGRAGLLVALFGLIRGLLRRIFGGGRTRRRR